MKIYNRTDFLKLPSGVIYAKGEEWGFDGISIKGESIGDCEAMYIDWLYTDLSWMDCGDDILDTRVLHSMLHDGKSLPSKRTQGRDGLYEEDTIFLVYEKSDLEFLKASIETAIKISDIKEINVKDEGSRKALSERAAIAASKVLHDPKNSKSSKTAAGLALTQRQKNER